MLNITALPASLAVRQKKCGAGAGDIDLEWFVEKMAVT
jgi:hypothetical protein